MSFKFVSMNEIFARIQNFFINKETGMPKSLKEITGGASIFSSAPAKGIIYGMQVNDSAQPASSNAPQVGPEVSIVYGMQVNDAAPTKFDDSAIDSDLPNKGIIYGMQTNDD